MQPQDSYHLFGLWAFLILFLGLAFILWRWPEGKQFTFSQHVAQYRHRILYYIALFSIVLPLLLLFFIHWFVPTYQISPWFSVFIMIASLTQYACTLIPEVGGWKTTYHRLLAGVSALALLPPLILLLTSSVVTSAAKLVTVTSIVIMVLIIWLIALGQGKHERLLYLQMGYFAAFFGPILFIAYIA